MCLNLGLGNTYNLYWAKEKVFPSSTTQCEQHMKFPKKSSEKVGENAT